MLICTQVIFHWCHISVQRNDRSVPSPRPLYKTTALRAPGSELLSLNYSTPYIICSQSQKWDSCNFIPSPFFWVHSAACSKWRRRLELWAFFQFLPWLDCTEGVAEYSSYNLHTLSNEDKTNIRTHFSQFLSIPWRIAVKYTHAQQRSCTLHCTAHCCQPLQLLVSSIPDDLAGL